MSQWTHVNASFRIDSIGGALPKEKIEEIMGKEYHWKDSYKDFFNDDNTPKIKILPYGSEGSLEYSIWNNPDEHCMASQVVTVFSDLRDYNNADELEEWFKKCCSTLWIRQAVIQIEIEYGNEIIISTLDGEKFNKNILARE